MATHTDHLYEGLGKITSYWESHKDYEGFEWEYLRHTITIPLLVIKDDLYELTVEKTKPKMKKVHRSMLVFNYYHGEEPTFAFVIVLTKKGLQNFVKEMIALEYDIETDMIEERIAKYGYPKPIWFPKAPDVIWCALIAPNVNHLSFVARQYFSEFKVSIKPIVDWKDDSGYWFRE